MKTLFLHFSLLMCCVCLAGNLFAQPAIQWDKTFGGPEGDYPYTIRQTPDGGYVVGGYSQGGQGGNKTDANFGGWDFWIVKVSANGTKEWDRTLGGINLELFWSLEVTQDGGIIAGGTSYSNASGTKTENAKSVDANGQPISDYWIIKLSSNGNIEWDKTIGGSGYDALRGIKQTPDGGFILSGVSDSPISGDKTKARLRESGGSDHWIVRLDAKGNKIWDSLVGTQENEVAFTLALTKDGGCIVGGGLNGEWPVSGDYYVAKLDQNGILQWDKKIGGNNYDELWDVQQTPDGGYILGGWSFSKIGRDKTEDTQNGDYWVVKLDAGGSIVWDKTIKTLSANQEDASANMLHSIVQTRDGAYLLGGNSFGNAGGDKTENSRGTNDFWLVKISATGSVLWDKTIGGSDDENLASMIQTSDGGFAMVGYSGSDISGEKTQNSRGNRDYWIVKLAPENPPLPQTTIRINAGGPAFTTATKKLFIADQYYAGIDRTSSIASGDILNTTNDVLYRSGRSSPAFSYNIPVVNGQVNVTLHFAETYFGAPGKKGGAGSRQFHVNIEGSRKLTNYDIFVAAGGALRAVQTTIPVTVSDGVLNIDFLTGAADQPRVCAIEVVSTSLTLSPVADAYVRDGSFSTTNFNLVSSLDIKTSSVDPSANRSSYLKFQLPSVTTIGAAKLRVYGRNHENTKSISLHAYGVNHDSWTEGGIVKANAPAASTASLGFVPVNDVYQYYEIDVTSYVKAQQQSGDALVSLLLKDPNNRNTRMVFNSKEAASYPPQLIIQTTTNSTARLTQEELSIEKQEKEPSTVFPNPVKDQLTISLSMQHAGAISFELIDESGKSHLLSPSGNATPGEKASINIAELSLGTGIYLLKVDSKGFTEVVKLLITQ